MAWTERAGGRRGCAGEGGMPSTAKTVLVVDDDPAMRAMVADYLGDRGFRVATRGRRRARWPGRWPPARSTSFSWT